jgi:hypothetical protein
MPHKQNTVLCGERGGTKRSVENDTNRWEWDACRVWRSTSCDGGAQSWDSLMEHLPSSQLHCLPLFSSSSRERAGFFFFFWLLILMKQRGGRTGREGFIYSQTCVGAGAGAGAGVKAWKVGNRSDLPMLQIQAVLVCAYHLLNYSYTPLRKKKTLNLVL